MVIIAIDGYRIVNVFLRLTEESVAIICKPYKSSFQSRTEQTINRMLTTPSYILPVC